MGGSMKEIPQSGASDDVVVVHRSPTKRKGFAQIPHAALIDPKLSDAAVRLYGILLSYAFQAESFKCSQAKMAADAGKDDRTVRRCLKQLHDRGLVTPIRQGQRLVNIYILEDAYALYDSEQPRPKNLIRNEKGQDKNVLSPERTKMSYHAGQKCPVPQDKNVLLLKNPKTNKKGEESEDSLALFSESEKIGGSAWDSLAEDERGRYEELAERELVEKFGIAAWSGFRSKKHLVSQRARNLCEEGHVFFDMPPKDCAASDMLS